MKSKIPAPLTFLREYLKEWEEKYKRVMDAERRKLWPDTSEINPLEHEGMK